MFCESCGHQMSDGAKFCPSCGAAVRQDVTEEEPATSAPSAEGMPEATDWATKPIEYAPTQPMPQPTGGDASPAPTEPLPTPTAPGDTGRMAVPVIPTSPMSVVPSPNPYSDVASERHPASGVAKWILIGVLAALLLVFAGFAMGFLGKSPSPSDSTASDSLSGQADGKEDAGSETDTKKDKADGEGEDAEEKSEKEDDGNGKKTDDEGDEEDKESSKVERTADGYMLPDSDKHRYSASELSGLSDWELKVARNEIYAKHGYRFESDDLRKHFEGCEWYEPTTSAGQFDEGLLNDVERYNVGLILSLESHDDEYVLPDSSVRRYSRSELTDFMVLIASFSGRFYKMRDKQGQLKLLQTAQEKIQE